MVRNDAGFDRCRSVPGFAVELSTAPVYINYKNATRLPAQHNVHGAVGWAPHPQAEELHDLPRPAEVRLAAA